MLAVAVYNHYKRIKVEETAGLEGRRKKVEDENVEIAKQYKKLGVKLLTGFKTTSIKDNGDNVTVEVESKDGSKTDRPSRKEVLIGRVM